MKKIIISRHGEVNNPRDLAYNRDAVMKKEDIIHLSQKGREQMKQIGEKIKKVGLNPVFLWVSPEIRAIESAEELNKPLNLSYEMKHSSSLRSKHLPKQDSGVRNPEPSRLIGTGSWVKPELDEVRTPGPYQKGITMSKWETLSNHYDRKIWARYNHETSKDVVSRMTNIFWQMVGKLQSGQSGILLSHGDPICWLLNKIILDKIPEYHQAQKNFFLHKAQAVVLELDQQNKLVKYTFL